MMGTETNNDMTKAPKWRRDFPIEWEGDHYVSRREMVKYLTLGSLLLAVGNWATALAARFRPRNIKSERYIGSTTTLDRNGLLLFRYPTDQDPCIAVRTAQGKLFAYSQVCTHLSCAVIYQRQENQLACPCHKGAFSVEEGAPIAGPPVRPLPRIRIEQRGDSLFAVEKEV